MNHLIVGIVVVALGLAGVFAFRLWEEWVLALLALWLLASPWVLGFSNVGAFVITDVLAGLDVFCDNWLGRVHGRRGRLIRIS